MSERGTVIFRRGSKSSGTASDAASDDMWDDKILIDLYDKALNVAHEEVAKRFAMSTNSPKDGSSKKNNKNGISQDKNNRKKNLNWRVGSECRAVYSEDGLEYEATISKINGDMCTILYLGYNNEEEVELSELKQSSGKYHRMQQSIEANDDASFDIEKQIDDEIPEVNPDDYLLSIPPQSNVSQKKVKGKKSKDAKAKTNKYPSNSGLPNPMSFLSSPLFPNMNFDSHIPLPPPFLPSISGTNSTEEQNLSSMLISWYMSGYYTGLYQGQKMAKNKK